MVVLNALWITIIMSIMTAYHTIICLRYIQTNTLLNGFTKYPEEIQWEVGRHERGIFRYSRVMSDLLVTINQNSGIKVINTLLPIE